MFRGSGRGRQQAETQEPETREARLGNRDGDGKKTKKRASPPRPRGSGSVPGELTAVHMWFPLDWEVEGLPLRGGLCTQRAQLWGLSLAQGRGGALA